MRDYDFDDDDCEDTNTAYGQEKNGGAFSRRDAVLSAVVGAASVMLANPEEAKATAPAEFAEETLKMIGMTKDILNGKDYDAAKKQYDPTKLAEFEEYRKYWFEKYQYQHGKSFYGYANTWNAQAKVGFQISMSSREEAKSEYPNGSIQRVRRITRRTCLRFWIKRRKKLRTLIAETRFNTIP